MGPASGLADRPSPPSVRPTARTSGPVTNVHGSAILAGMIDGIGRRLRLVLRQPGAVERHPGRRSAERQPDAGADPRPARGRVRRLRRGRPAFRPHPSRHRATLRHAQRPYRVPARATSSPRPCPRAARWSCRSSSCGAKSSSSFSRPARAATRRAGCTRCRGRSPSRLARISSRARCTVRAPSTRWSTSDAASRWFR